MPKYRDKIRLKKFEKRVKEVDDFTRYLILAGYGDDLVQEGLEAFVKTWEAIVEWYNEHAGNLGLCSEEFNHDVSCRDELHTIIQKAPENQIEKMRKRIEYGDNIFKQATIGTSSPVFDGIRSVISEEHWWLFRMPREWLS